MMKTAIDRWLGTQKGNTWHKGALDNMMMDLMLFDWVFTQGIRMSDSFTVCWILTTTIIIICIERCKLYKFIIK
jgi:hypothetical protein